MNMPVFFDDKTPKPFIDPTVPLHRGKWPEDASTCPFQLSFERQTLTTFAFRTDAIEGAALPDHIYMDAMGFGMGCCCLQITFQACSVSEARRMYDAFIPVGPIMVSPVALYIFDNVLMP